MTSTLRTALLVVGLGTHLAALGISLTLGLVTCTEPDGRVAFEVSENGVLCGGASAVRASGRGLSISIGPALVEAPSSHCDDCQDVPLQLAAYVAVERHNPMAAPATGEMASIPQDVHGLRTHVETTLRAVTVQPIVRAYSIRTTILRI